VKLLFLQFVLSICFLSDTMGLFATEWTMASGHIGRRGILKLNSPALAVSLGEVRPSYLSNPDRIAMSSGWAQNHEYTFGLPDQSLLDLVSGSLVSGVAISGDLIFLGTDDEAFVCIDQIQKKVIWKMDLKTQVISDPLLRGSYVYVGGMDGKLRALNAKNGSVEWETDFQAPLHSSPMSFDAYLFQSDRLGHLSAFSFPEHRALWSTTLPSGVIGTPLGYGGRLYLATEAGHLFCFDAREGTSLWQKSLNGGVRGGMAVHPATTDNSAWVVVGTDRGQLHWFSLDGVEWGASPLQLDSEILTPVVGGDMMMVPSLKSLYQIDPFHGEILMSFAVPTGEWCRAPVFDGQQLWLHSVLRQNDKIRNGSDYGFTFGLNKDEDSPLVKLKFTDDFKIDGVFDENSYGNSQWQKLSWHHEGAPILVTDRYSVSYNKDCFFLALEIPKRPLGQQGKELHSWFVSLRASGNEIDKCLSYADSDSLKKGAEPWLILETQQKAFSSKENVESRFSIPKTWRELLKRKDVSFYLRVGVVCEQQLKDDRLVIKCTHLANPEKVEPEDAYIPLQFLEEPATEK
jgi:hypothetical protein